MSTADATDATDATEGSVESRPSPRPDRRRDVLWVVLVFVVLGLLGGLLWQWVAPRPVAMRTDQGAVLTQAQLAVKIGADGWFAVVGVVAGLLAGFGLVRPRRDALLVVVLGTAASVGAAYLALWLGTSLTAVSPGALADARPGTRIEVPLRLVSHLVVLAWPLGFLVAAVASLWGEGRPSTGDSLEE